MSQIPSEVERRFSGGLSRIGLENSLKEGEPPWKNPYHTIEKKDTQELAQFLRQNGQFLLPMVELIEQSRMAVDELVDVVGRAQIETVLRLSAEKVARPPQRSR